jgi:hypothetical protein
VSCYHRAVALVYGETRETVWYDPSFVCLLNWYRYLTQRRMPLTQDLKEKKGKVSERHRVILISVTVNSVFKLILPESYCYIHHAF